MLKKFPASNALAAIFKNANFSQGSLKVPKLSKCRHFLAYWKPFSLLVINGSTIISCKDWHTF